MIVSIRHKGLRLLWTKNDTSKLQANRVKKLKNILTLLNGATQVEDMNYPGAGLHALKVSLKVFGQLWLRAITG